jgi:hypothetical protein
MNRKRRSFHDQDDSEVPYTKISKFTKVKEKAKQMKIEKRKALEYKERKAQGLKGRGGGGRGTKFNGKGNGMYSKPGGGGFKKKPGQRVAGRAKGGSQRKSGDGS